MTMEADSPPSLDIPASDVSAKVSAIDSTLWLKGMPGAANWRPAIKGFERPSTGAWIFLIEHPSGRKILYDLGMRKDWRNVAPASGAIQAVDSGILEGITVRKNVSEILEGGGLDLHDIEAVIWSHFHFDHTGDMSTFPTSTKLIMGEGAKDAFMPGYPVDPMARTMESDFVGREVQEIAFSGQLLIGRFRAYDYFGDGSFYLLDSPGHAIGHLNALVRTNTGDSSDFIHLGGDCAHHAGEIRPSPYLPLPDSIKPSPIPDLHVGACPGEVFSCVLKNGTSKTEPIIEWQDAFAEHTEPKYSLLYDEPELRETIKKVQESDANDNTFIILAHDWSLKGIIDEWPLELNDWRRKNWRRLTRWKFLEDFKEAVVENGKTS